VQLVGQVAALPLHKYAPQSVAGAAASVSTVQTPSDVAPSDALQTSQAPAQAALQHTPSEQNEDAHSAAELHAAPFVRAQIPVGPHDELPAQVSGSGAFVTAVHTPERVPRLHPSHVPQAAWSQQTPSTQ
jgi:hypothetical protein